MLQTYLFVFFVGGGCCVLEGSATPCTLPPTRPPFSNYSKKHTFSGSKISLVIFASTGFNHTYTHMRIYTCICTVRQVCGSAGALKEGQPESGVLDGLAHRRRRVLPVVGEEGELERRPLG
jgi:hypothetical protein